MVFLLFAALATAANLDAEALQGAWLSLQQLELDTKRYRVVTEPIEIQNGPVTLTVNSGILVPVFAAHSVQNGRAQHRAKVDSWKNDSYVSPDQELYGGREFVGFVYVSAEGGFSVDFQERAQGLVWATHQVRDLHADPDDWRHVAHGEAWTGSTSEGLVLSIAPEVERLFLGPPLPGREPDPLEVVVYGEKLRPGALLRAASLFESRQHDWSEVQLQPGQWMAQDRLAELRGHGTAEGEHALIEFRVDAELGLLGFTPETQPKGLRWLSLLVDERGELDPRKRSILAAFGRDSSGETVIGPVTGEVFAVDSEGVPRATTRIVGQDAQVKVVAIPRASDIQVKFEADLQLQAVGGTVDWFSLSLPRAGSRRDFELVSATLLDGRSVISDNEALQHDRTFRPTEPPNAKDDLHDNLGELLPGGKKRCCGKPPQLAPDLSVTPKARKLFQSDPYLSRPETQVIIALPEPLHDGDEVILHVVWEDVWPNLNVEATPFGDMAMSPGSGIQRVLPRPGGTTASNPWRFTIVAATPADRGLAFALPGETVSVKEEKGWRFYHALGSEHPSAFIEVAMAHWKHSVAEAEAGMPLIETFVGRAGGSDALVKHFRQIATFYQGYLPRYPWKRQVIFQAPSEWNEHHWLATQNLTQVMQTMLPSPTVGGNYAVLENNAPVSVSTANGKFDAVADPSRLFAHNVARQWWGQLVQIPHEEDFWMSETLPESFACGYLDATNAGCDALLDVYADTWEKFDSTRTPRASLTQAYSGQPHQPSVVYRYGTYVIHRMLQDRIGHEAYHEALDTLAREKAYESVTTEHLEASFSRASGEDLSDFFDFWVYAGFIPRRAELTWWVDGEALHGRVDTDLPFGAFDMQVAVDDQRVWVDLVDGVGEFSLEVDAEPTTVVLDPDRLTLVNHRRVKRVPAG